MTRGTKTSQFGLPGAAGLYRRTVGFRASAFGCLALLAVWTAAGCGTTSTAGEAGSISPAVFGPCLSTYSDGSAQLSKTSPTAAWERSSHPITMLAATFASLYAGSRDTSIWSGSAISADRLDAAFFATPAAAARAAAGARRETSDTVEVRLNAVVAFDRQPSDLQRGLLAGCLLRALAISRAKPQPST